MVPTRQERSENIARMRKQQILDAALQVFSDKGFATATTAEIARGAGIAEGTIYKYFPSKRELFIAVIRNVILTTPLLELIDKLPQGNLAETFHNIMQNRLNLLESEQASTIPAFMVEIQRDPELRTLWKKHFIDPFFSKLEGSYQEMIATGRVRRMEPAVLVRIIGGFFIGFLLIKVIEGDTSPLNRMPREEIINAIVTVLFHGLLDDRTNEKE
jgi:AcrR family transcriptional regulator